MVDFTALLAKKKAEREAQGGVITPAPVASATTELEAYPPRSSLYFSPIVARRLDVVLSLLIVKVLNPL